MKVPNLRSPSEKVNDLVYFGRMLDKIRLNAKGELPADYVPNLGIGFDGQIIEFLWLDYPLLAARVKEGGSDEEILQWCFEQGRHPSAKEIFIWNEFMRKRGWNDELSPRLQMRLKEGGFENRTDIQTFFDYIDLDEGRK